MLRKTLATILILTATSAQAAGSTLDRLDAAPGTGAPPLLLAQVSTLYGAEESWPIEIDIKPGSESNEIPIKTERVFPIAIFGSEKLDITKLNPRTIRVTAAGKKLVGRADTRTCQRKDLNGDSREDLVCNVKTVAFRLDPGELEVTLVAETYEHQPLKGTGTIVIVGN
ncbi:MAG: hypothetical protein PVJ78_07105 [Gammaproteobacteria bacterium]|jgi:hypothetical protein